MRQRERRRTLVAIVGVWRVLDRGRARAIAFSNDLSYAKVYKVREHGLTQARTKPEDSTSRARCAAPPQDCYAVCVTIGSASPILDEARRPLRRVEYDKLVETGLLRDERVELLYGSIVQMSPIGAPHSGTVQYLTELLVLALQGRASVRIQLPFAANDSSEPEPDVAVVPPGRYVDDHPSVASLIVEVADSSLKLDREIKARLYAESGVPEYWVVNLVDRLIEVHTHIVRGAYTRVTPYQPGEAIRLQRFSDVEVAASSVLP